jgi:hypothetical protein
MGYPWSAGDTLAAADLNSFFSKLVTTVASVTTSVAIAADTTDIYIITAQAGAILFSNPTGSVANGKCLMIRIKDNGTARAITWDTQFRGIGVTLPSTTVISKTLYMIFVYNSTDTKWDFVAYAQE